VRTGTSALLLGLAFLAACDGTPKTVVRANGTARPDEISFTSIDSPSLAFLPRQQEAPGWRLEEDPIVIPGNRLAGSVDNASAQFVNYGALDLTEGKYRATTGDAFASVEIYRFPDFVKAFGAYSTQKVGGLKYLDIPNESFVKVHSLHLWRGPFYVRVVGDGGDSMLRLLTFIADRTPAAPGRPAVFNFLPDKQRVANSERYSAASGFGQSYLGNSFQASFNVDGDIVEGLIIPAANRQAAANILNAYRSLYVHNGKLLDPIPNLGEDNFTAEDKYLGRTVAFRMDRFVIAFNGYKDRQHLIDLSILTAQRILANIRKQLVTAEENGNGGRQNVNQPAWMRR